MLIFWPCQLDSQANLCTSVSDALFLAMHARVCSCLHTVSADILDALLLLGSALAYTKFHHGFP